jgi:hypothetical protein
MTISTPSRDSTAEHGRLAQATGRAEDDRRSPILGMSGAHTSRARLGHRTRGLQQHGDAWSFFPHDQARSRAYRWNEDGMAGLSDVHHDLVWRWRCGTVLIRS